MYQITSESHRLFKRQLAAAAPGKRILEIGSGGGSNVLELCSHGAQVTGIDLSDAAVELARTHAKNGNFRNATYLAMDAEYLDFPDDSFDIVCGGAILHHLRLERALPHIARVIAPGGYGLFLEPLGYNPIINLYRRLTPRFRSPDEHPLLEQDLRMIRAHFGTVNVRYFYLSTLALFPIARTAIGRRLIPIANAFDRALFRIAPFLRKYAWIVILELRDPIKSAVPAAADASLVSNLH